MLQKKECIAMVLAGGQGSRLKVLTKRVAKPAVPFGGKYRIIDFSLSNCSNSGIDTVGVLIQYEPLALSSYIGIGSPWGLDRRTGGVTVLPPFVRESSGEWYAGTANAVQQNMQFIENYDPEYLLVLSGDHIYKMDYSKMLDYHKQKQAAATIAVIEVPWEEASRFGIMNCNSEQAIIEFDEKPAHPKNNLASMGVYIFDWPVLKKHLDEDAVDSSSAHDFGKNVIPKMLAEKERMFAYRFDGYWKDVGTLDSLWEANMDLLGASPELDLNDTSWRIYSVNPTQPAHFISNEAVVRNALVNEGCHVEGTVQSSILFPGVSIGRGSRVVDSVLMPDVKVGDNVLIEKAIIGSEALIGDGSHVGADRKNNELTVVADHTEVAANSKLNGVVG